MVVDGVFVNALTAQNKAVQDELKALNRATEIPKPSVIYKKCLELTRLKNFSQLLKGVASSFK